MALHKASEDPRFLASISGIRYRLWGRTGYAAPFCNSPHRAEIVSQHFPGLLRISNRPIFTFILAQLHILTSLQMSGILILTKVVSSHLLQNRGYQHFTKWQAGQARSQSHHSQWPLREASNLPLATVCKPAVHLMLWESFQLVTSLVLIFRIRQDPKFLPSVFSNHKVWTSLFLAASAAKSCMKSFVNFYRKWKMSQKPRPMQLLGKTLPQSLGTR